MKVTITSFRRLAVDANGNVLPMGGDRIEGATLTAAGSTVAHSEAEFVRIATDTAITHDAMKAGASNPELMPAGSVEFFPVAGGNTITVALA